MHFKKSGSFRFYLENNTETVISTRNNTVCEHLELKDYFNSLIHSAMVDKPIRLFLSPCKMPNSAQTGDLFSYPNAVICREHFGMTGLLVII